jgi:2-oxoglutarate ferredoxin oxidoreductase subunit beta
VALANEATFVARSIDTEVKHLAGVLVEAARHKGVSFVEVYQNCNIFNDGAYDHLTDKDTKADNVLVLEHGKPLVFGKENDKGLKLDGFNPVVISLKDGKYSINDVLVHDEKSRELAFILSELTEYKGFPTPIGVFLDIERSTYETEMAEQIETSIAKSGKGDLEKLLYSGNTWNIN